MSGRIQCVLPKLGETVIIDFHNAAAAKEIAELLLRGGVPEIEITTRAETVEQIVLRNPCVPPK